MSLTAAAAAGRVGPVVGAVSLATWSRAGLALGGPAVYLGCACSGSSAFALVRVCMVVVLGRVACLRGWRSWGVVRCTAGAGAGMRGRGAGGAVPGPGVARSRVVTSAWGCRRLRGSGGVNRGVRVIPVLVDGAKAPKQQQLPDDLQRLARLNVLEVSWARLDYDATRLMVQGFSQCKLAVRLAVAPPLGGPLLKVQTEAAQTYRSAVRSRGISKRGVPVTMGSWSGSLALTGAFPV